MSKYGDENRRYTPLSVYGNGHGHNVQKSDSSKDSEKPNSNDAAEDKKDSDTDTASKTDTTDDTAKDAEKDSSDESDTKNTECEFKSWLEVLPSKGGLLLAVLLVEIMTDGLTPNQMNILGNFVASVGTLISYKASRDDLDVTNP